MFLAGFRVEASEFGRLGLWAFDGSGSTLALALIKLKETTGGEVRVYRASIRLV